MTDNFTKIPFTANNLDRYFIRTSIFNAIKESVIHFNGALLDAGCGKMPYKDFILRNSTVKNYIGLDIEGALEYDPSIKPDYIWNGIEMPFKDASFDTVFATEVLEHCADPLVMLRETYRVMKDGGCFFFTVPFLWNLHEVPHDEYRYTPFALKRLLSESGFKGIEIKATGGWHASMGQMLGLWVRRAPIANGKRKILSYMIKPVIKQLIKMDKRHQVEFSEGQMITGLFGLAYKP
jgi:SAM-dependent methyltransferase